MNRKLFASLVVLILLLVGIPSIAFKTNGRVLPELTPAATVSFTQAQPPEPAQSGPATRFHIGEVLGKLPLYFIENRGQLDERVAYYVQGRDTSVYFGPQGVTFALTSSDSQQAAVGAEAAMHPVAFWGGQYRLAPLQRWTVKLDFVGANPNVELVGQLPTPAVISYFKGPRETWQRGLRTYASVRYSNLWPGIDLVYTGTGERLKYSFVVRPGADPGQIRLAYRGATAVRLNDVGELEVSTPAGSFVDEKPHAYQRIDGQQVEVTTAYAPEGVAAAGSRYAYGFDVGRYDSSKTLVIDPAVLVYAGYIGGSRSDYGLGIAVDNAGNAYVIGVTWSGVDTFPVAVGPDLSHNGSGDAFVAKVKADGTALVYAGYIGGSSNDYGWGIAVDGVGNAYVVGSTHSTEASFPVLRGPDLTYNGGNDDAFVAKVKADGTGLVYAGYIGGSGDESGNGIAVDNKGSSYITGYTNSTEATFPATVGPDLTLGGDFDAFVAKVDVDGSTLVYAGYVGGSSPDHGQGIAVDGAGNAYVTGDTMSADSFPKTGGPDLTLNGGYDAFATKVKADGTAFVYAGFIGGSREDIGRGIAVDSTGNAYITGSTMSTEATFPVSGGPDLTYNGGKDAFVAKVKADGTGLGYAGYIGGSGDDNGFGIAVDGAGNAYITGDTMSTEATFPVTGGLDATYNGGYDDTFVAKVKMDGTGLDYAGYIGGSGSDIGRGIAVDGVGNVYVVGHTHSSEATFPVTGGVGLSHYGGQWDAFVAGIAEPSLQISETDWYDPLCPGFSQRYEIVITNTSLIMVTGVTVTDTLSLKTSFLDKGTTPGYVYNPATNEVVWPIDTLGAGVHGSLYLNAGTNATLQDGEVIENVVAADSSETALTTSSAETTVSGQPIACTPSPRATYLLYLPVIWKVE